MIYEAQVSFQTMKALIYVPGEAQLIEKTKYKLLVSPHSDYISFINIPATPLGRVYLAPCKSVIISPTECRLYHEVKVENKEKGQQKKSTEQITIVTIQSTQPCIKDIVSKCTTRKHKSSLSFSPSSVRHISILSGQSPTQKYRGFINLIIIMFIVLNIRNMIDNFLRYGSRFKKAPLDFLPLSGILGVLSIFCFVQLGFRLDRLRFHRILSDSVVRILLKINQVGLLVYVALFCQRYLSKHPGSGMFFTSLGLVMFLKLVSYMQVNTELLQLLQRINALARAQFNEFVFANHEISQQNLEIITKNRRNWQNIVTRYRLMYFLIAPTLCYQLQYPRSPVIRITWILKRLAQLVFVCIFYLVLWSQYMQPELQAWRQVTLNKDSDWLMYINKLLRLSIPNTIGWILGFYALFHLSLNIISEMIRFGDRNFYSDWWNCRSLEQYWKTWNLPIHFFFLRHCYTPLLKKGLSRHTAGLVVFLLSALGHEYVVCVPLGLLSYYAFLGMLMQAPAIALQKFWAKYVNLKESELGNVSFWLSFCFIGQPLVFFIYYSLYMSKFNQ